MRWENRPAQLPAQQAWRNLRCILVTSMKKSRKRNRLSIEGFRINRKTGKWFVRVRTPMGRSWRRKSPGVVLFRNSSGTLLNIKCQRGEIKNPKRLYNLFGVQKRSTKEKGRGDDPTGQYLYIHPIHVVCMELNRVRRMCEWIQILRNAIQLSMDVYGVELDGCLSGRLTENLFNCFDFRFVERLLDPGNTHHFRLFRWSFGWIRHVLI